ncbi:MAG: hypothetical protein ACLUSP_11625 [Christensenellales bacterium]
MYEYELYREFSFLSPRACLGCFGCFPKTQVRAFSAACGNVSNGSVFYLAALPVGANCITAAASDVSRIRCDAESPSLPAVISPIRTSVRFL